MIIFIEGPDECGKTHIAHALCELYNLQYWKNEDGAEFDSGSLDLVLKYHYSKLPKMCALFQSLNSGIVFDRNFISEAVYSKVFQRHTYQNIIELLNLTYAEMGAVVIYCTKSKYKNFDDPHIDIDHVEKIKEAYEEYFETHTEIPVLRLDTTSEDLEDQLEKIDNFLLRRCNGCSHR